MSTEKHSTNAERFIKTDLELLAIPGLSPRLRELYGRLRLHAGADGWCFPKWKTLAKIGVSVKNPTTVYRLLCQLKALKLVEWKRHGRYSNEYRMLTPDIAFLQAQTLQKCNVSDIAGLQYRKDSSSKEAFKRPPAPTPPPPWAGPRAKPPRKPEASRRAAGEAENAKSNSDDDEKPKPRPHALTEAEFRDVLKERHGATFDADRCLANIRRQLEKCSGLSLTDFLKYDAERTTAPKAIHNPHGYYTQLAKQLRHATVAAGLAAAFDPLRAGADAAVPEPERDRRGLCTKCGGPGVLKDGTYCTCAMGRDLENLERRDKAQTAKKGPASESKGRKILNFPRKGATT